MHAFLTVALEGFLALSIVLSVVVVLLQSWQRWSPVGTLAVLAFLAVGLGAAARVAIVIGQAQLVPLVLLAAYLALWTALTSGRRTTGGQG